MSLVVVTNFTAVYNVHECIDYGAGPHPLISLFWLCLALVLYIMFPMTLLDEALIYLFKP